MNSQCVLRDTTLTIFDHVEVEAIQALTNNYFLEHLKLDIRVTPDRIQQTFDTVVKYMLPPKGDLHTHFHFTQEPWSKIDLFNETLNIIIQNILELYFSQDDPYDPWNPTMCKWMNGTVKLNEKKPKTTIIMKY